MAMDHVTTLECTICEKEYDPDQIIYTLSRTRGASKGILEVKYDYDVIDDNFDADLDGNISRASGSTKRSSRSTTMQRS